MIFELLFGWILELFPLSMSATARRRAWRRGRRAVVRARAADDLRVDHLALLNEELWIIRNLGFEAESMTKVDWSDVLCVRLPAGRLARPDDTVVLGLESSAISITCPLDLELLREAALVWQTKVGHS